MNLIDGELDRGIWDVEAQRDNYRNWKFQFIPCNTSAAQVFPGIGESLWLRFWLFLRTVIGRIHSSPVTDWHRKIFAALAARSDAAFWEAIRPAIYARLKAIGLELFGADART